MLLEEYFPRYHQFPELSTIHFLPEQRGHQCTDFWAIAPEDIRKQTLGSTGISGSSLITSAHLVMAGGQMIAAASLCKLSVLYTLCFIFTLLESLGKPNRIIKWKSKD